MPARSQQPAEAEQVESAEAAPQSEEAESPEPNKPVAPSLPPRIVVELPDGGVFLGEDDERLVDERQAVAQQQALTTSQAALPGTEVWVEMRRLLYATALDTLVLTRKRHAAVLLSAPLHCP